MRELAEAIRHLATAKTVRVDRLAVDAGLALVDAGGDFADGVIVYDGRSLGGTTCVSFDRAAVRRLGKLGISAREPA